MKKLLFLVTALIMVFASVLMVGCDDEVDTTIEGTYKTYSLTYYDESIEELKTIKVGDPFMDTTFPDTYIVVELNEDGTGTISEVGEISDMTWTGSIGKMCSMTIEYDDEEPVVLSFFVENGIMSFITDDFSAILKKIN